MNATATNNTESAAVLPIARKSNQWLDAKDIRNLLKQNLGLNSKQVSVSKGHSTQYMKLTVRDASVELAKVEAFARALDTWNMDVTDYVTGQSLTVETSEEVDAIHRAPFIAKVHELIALVPTMEDKAALILDDVCDGLRLWKDAGEVWFTRGERRRCYRRTRSLSEDWSVEALALDIARLSAL